MAKEDQIWLHLVSGWVITVFEVVENVDLTIVGLRCDDLIPLRHVASSINFTKVIDLNFDLDALIFGDLNCAKS